MKEISDEGFHNNDHLCNGCPAKVTTKVSCLEPLSFLLWLVFLPQTFVSTLFAPSPPSPYLVQNVLGKI